MEVKIKDVNGINYLFLALCAFVGLGIEVF